MSDSKIESLKFFLRENEVAMNTLQNKKRKSESSFIKQRDQHIKQLEEQLKLRDKVITKNSKLVSQANLRLSPEIKETFDQIKPLKVLRKSSPDLNPQIYSITPQPSIYNKNFPVISPKQRPRIKRSANAPPSYIKIVTQESSEEISKKNLTNEHHVDSSKRLIVNLLHPDAVRETHQKKRGSRSRSNLNVSIKSEKSKLAFNTPSFSIAEKYESSLYIQRPGYQNFKRSSISNNHGSQDLGKRRKSIYGI